MACGVGTATVAWAGFTLRLWEELPRACTLLCVSGVHRGSPRVCPPAERSCGQCWCQNRPIPVLWGNSFACLNCWDSRGALREPAESFAEGSWHSAWPWAQRPFPGQETELNSGNGCMGGCHGHPPASSKDGDARLCFVHSRVVGHGCAVVRKLIAALQQWRRSWQPSEPSRLRQLSGPSTEANLSIQRCRSLMGVFKVIANRPL